MASSVTTPTGLVALTAGARLAVGRLVCRRLVVVALLATMVTAMTALVERSHQPVDAASRMLTVAFGLVVPLSSFAVLAIATGRRRLDEAIWPLARHGLRGSHVALGLLLGAQAVAAALALVAIEVGLLLSHGLAGQEAGTIGLGRDVMISGWIAALGGAAYVAWLGLGAAFLRFGRGRWLVLAADFVLGLGTGYVAVWWPRGHLRNLIGGEPLLELSQATTSVLLAAVTVMVTVLAAMRSGD